MPISLFIPWFKAQKMEFPLPLEIPIFGDSFPVFAFALMVWTSVLVGIRVTYEYARHRGLSTHHATSLGVHCIGIGFVGAYLFNALFYETHIIFEAIEKPRLLVTTWFGLSSYGGFIGATLGALWWKHKRKQPLLPYLDAAVFALPFGWFFGRLGCFMVHDHPGIITDFFLAVDNYEFGQLPYEPRHDLGFYEVILSVIIAEVVLWCARRPRPAGFYVAIVPLMYAPVRYFLDFLRAPSQSGGDTRLLGLTPGQYASFAFIMIALIILQRHVLRTPHFSEMTVTREPPSSYLPSRNSET